MEQDPLVRLSSVRNAKHSVSKSVFGHQFSSPCGRTAPMIAVVRGLSEIVADLVVYLGTDRAIVDDFGRTAHTEALRVKKPWVLELLLRAPEDIVVLSIMSFRPFRSRNDLTFNFTLAY